MLSQASRRPPREAALAIGHVITLAIGEGVNQSPSSTISSLSVGLVVDSWLASRAAWSISSASSSLRVMVATHASHRHPSSKNRAPMYAASRSQSRYPPSQSEAYGQSTREADDSEGHSLPSETSKGVLGNVDGSIHHDSRLSIRAIRQGAHLAPRAAWSASAMPHRSASM